MENEENAKNVHDYDGGNEDNNIKRKGVLRREKIGIIILKCSINCNFVYFFSQK